jgi:hypothetical protein
VGVSTANHEILRQWEGHANTKIIQLNHHQKKLFHFASWACLKLARQRGNITPRAFRNAHTDQQGTPTVNPIVTSVRLAHRVPVRRTATVQAEPLPGLPIK